MGAQTGEDPCLPTGASDPSLHSCLRMAQARPRLGVEKLRPGD